VRAYFLDKQEDKATQYFSKALAVLEYHWGPYHPLQNTIYGVMSNLLISVGRLQDAKYLNKSSLDFCL
jgi:hypothetical protein